ncbi:hypothetical protein B0H94_11553 [Salsuginibacillus halophilus]|uniref:Sporulation and spore germination protein n=1 Tax=Salsuginibacillus halophilus TaxID=517424 RepID=A0A2P8H8F5_9BACI|nr:hypothetical protein [Salsuginibacillus halophilus]PSL42449.1 hypothetical protein B0H94_11553 [Salsuginibacillus halophilus]
MGKWTDEEIKAHLQQVQGPEDHRSKDEIYESLTRRRQNEPVKTRRRALPYAAGAAAAALFIGLSATFVMLSPQNEIADEGEREETQSEDITGAGIEEEPDVSEEGDGSGETDASQESEEEPELARDEESASESETQQVEEPEAAPSPEADEIPEVQEPVPETVEAENTWGVTTAYDPEARYVIPFSFPISEQDDVWEVINAADGSAPADALGLEPNQLEALSFQENSDGVAIQVEEHLQSLSSSESDLLYRSIQEILRFMGVDEASVIDGSGEATELGAFGAVETIYAAAPGAYFLYEYAPEEAVFLTAAAAGRDAPPTIEEAAASWVEGEQADEDLQAPVPSAFAAPEIEEVEAQHVTFRFTTEEEVELTEAEKEVMMQAVQLTAGAYGYDEVTLRLEDEVLAEGMRAFEAPNEIPPPES